MLPPQKYLIKIIGLTTSNSWYRLVPATPSPWLHMATTMDQDHPEQLFSGWVGRGQPTTSTYVGGSIWDEVPRHRSYLVGPVVLLVLVVVRTRPVAQSLLCIMDTWTPRTTPVPVHHIQLPWLDLMWYNVSHGWSMTTSQNKWASIIRDKEIVCWKKNQGLFKWQETWC